MSNTSTTVTAEHFAYLAARTPGEDAFLNDLKRAATAAGIPQIWVSVEQASFMQVLLRVARATEVVEVGTLAGSSAISMARALPAGGRVRTVEVDPMHAAFARDWAARSDVGDRVEVHEGDARDVLGGFADESADACFIDADKEGYSAYVDQCVRILRPGGLLMVDNAFAFGQLFEPQPDADVRAILAVNDAIAARDDLHGIITPFGDGCWVAAKVATEPS